MRRTLSSILVVLALMIGSMAMINVDETQEQEKIACDDCAHDTERRESVAYCDDCAHDTERRESVAYCDDCAHDTERRESVA